MKILEIIGSVIGGLAKVAAAQRQVAFDKIAIMKAIDANLVLVEGFQMLYRESPLVFSALGRRVTGNPKVHGGSKMDEQLGHIYQAYCHKLTYQIAALERRSFLKSFDAAATIFARDLHLLRDNFEQLFGVERSGLTVSELRVSHAVALGYLERVRMTMEWCSYLTGLIGHPDSAWVPRYLVAQLDGTKEQVATTINALAQRGHHTIIDELEQLKRSGNDVYLTTDGRTIDGYAHDSDYAENADELAGFVRSPIIKFHDMIAAISRYFYDRNRSIRDWLAARIAALQLELNGMDPNSPEYQEKQKVIEKYLAMIADYDKKIADYEK